LSGITRTRPPIARGDEDEVAPTSSPPAGDDRRGGDLATRSLPGLEATCSMPSPSHPLRSVPQLPDARHADCYRDSFESIQDDGHSDFTHSAGRGPAVGRALAARKNPGGVPGFEEFSARGHRQRSSAWWMRPRSAVTADTNLRIVNTGLGLAIVEPQLSERVRILLVFDLWDPRRQWRGYLFGAGPTFIPRS
jgi:hypothetical protein